MPNLPIKRIPVSASSEIIYPADQKRASSDKFGSIGWGESPLEKHEHVEDHGL